MPFRSLMLAAGNSANADMQSMERTYQQCIDNCAKKTLIKPTSNKKELQLTRKEFIKEARNCELKFISTIPDRAIKTAMKGYAKSTKKFFLRQDPQVLPQYFAARAYGVLPHF